MGKPPESDPDREAFLRAMQGVRPLPAGPRRVPPRPARRTPPPPAPRALGPGPPIVPAVRREAATAPASREFLVHEVGETVAGRAQDTDAKLLRRLQRGEIATEASLDLHGYTAEQSEAAVVRFVLGAVTRSQRCVLVVHGRGLHSDRGAVLKARVLDLLTRGPLQAHVLAFASARPEEGGAGATRLLLRRQRPR